MLGAADPMQKDTAQEPDKSKARSNSSSAAPRADSKFGGQVRSGKDYYEKWNNFAEAAAAGADSDDEEAQDVPIKPASKVGVERCVMVRERGAGCAGQAGEQGGCGEMFGKVCA